MDFACDIDVAVNDTLFDGTVCLCQRFNAETGNRTVGVDRDGVPLSRTDLAGSRDQDTVSTIGTRSRRIAQSRTLQIDLVNLKVGHCDRLDGSSV